MFDYRRNKPVSETKWTRIYRRGDRLIHESKFERDGLEVSVELVKNSWAGLSVGEKLDFAQAFSAKNEISAEDQRILDFLMNAGDLTIWATIARLLPRHGDRERTLGFLLKRIQEGSHHRANFFHALGLMKDKRAVPALRAAYDGLRPQLTASPGALERVDYVDYLSCCQALWQLEGLEEYRNAIREFSNSPDQRVRSFASALLQDL
jgi:hypothetical protein